MNWYMFTLVFGSICVAFGLVVFEVSADRWVGHKFGSFAAICFRVLFVAVVAGLVAAVLA